MRIALFAAAFGLLLSTTANAAGFSLGSPDVNERRQIGEKFVFNGFGCEGDNVSPALVWIVAQEAPGVSQ
jgi:phosphatidylethanolamine-binding protein (PEBP) family uncharacterized protein